jgi:predicted aspartyl protease
MLGTFSNGQPRIEIQVKGVSGVPKTINAIIDTGFNGYLKLPFLEAFPLGLVLAGVQNNTLADGSSITNLVCKGQVCIDGKCINTTMDVHKSNIILIGTQLLRELGKKFTLNCEEGLVEISD